MKSQLTGRQGEQIAFQFLQSKGYKILHRNFRAKRYGEIDLIAAHPNCKTLVFVEVKTRSSDEFGSPENAITWHKKKELKKMVDYFYNLFPNETRSPQVDVIAIDLETKKLRHLENVIM